MAAMPVPAVRFAKVAGGRLAWQAWGDGDETIVAIPPAAQNIETAWEWHEIRAMLERFGSFAHYVHFDKRGTGASDRGDEVPGLDTRVDDLRAVMDDAGVAQAHLFAQSEGGPTALLFAATYPHRVKSLILHGTGACVVPSELAADPEVRRDQIEKRRKFADAWGTPDTSSIGLFAPSKVGDRAFIEWFVRYERTAASAQGVFDLMTQMLDMDVRDVVGEIEAPMLVLHRSDETAMPVEYAHELVGLARDATLVELDGADHFAFVGDIDTWMTEVERWVTGTVRERPVDEGPRSPKVTTLGRFAVEVGGVEVDAASWGSRRARVLLKRLVVAEGAPVTRDELFDLLWPDETDRTRLGARLSVQLSAVRKVLGGGVRADRDSVALDRDQVRVDLFDYLDAAAAGSDATVVEHYGEFLPEQRYDDWAAPMRERVRSIFTTAAHRRITAAIDADDTSEAIDLARRVLVADPTDELAHASLVDALQAAGDDAAARRARDEWRAAAPG
ncbi:alpha/beta hydrolase [Ilumatobacter coccineus]|uniref:Bacterial transcriptional activator domain-containing protein n=1 Tax=Ilumatobacter coccineus (strain NBRC 103263 / KCTC 29153 / YM16-304) TaxID=1313172 RepID=A0A6C7E7X6_ILUCY|nr:alpha/beta hydrolase [Ilumatobacter coccineus]BAN01309.1 hypothetical protein YM304_09950 [Ilumatobacter coccineus YM16-304]